MNLLKKWIFRLLLLLVAVVALLAGSDNSESVTLKFLDYESIALPVAWWMIAAFVVGVLFGSVLNLWSNARLRLNARSANREAEARTRELEAARADSVVAD